MNEHDDGSELPRLENEDVELLYSICKIASNSSDPPFKALFAAYDEVFAEQQIEQEHDGVIFRYLMRVGESTRAVKHSRGHVDLVELLRTILENLGIQVVDLTEEERDDITRSSDISSPAKGQHLKDPKRRVSFDDARLDETWLSEYSHQINPGAAQKPGQPLDVSSPRDKDAGAGRRARSVSSQRNVAIRSAAPKHSPLASSKSVSEAGDYGDRKVDFRTSQAELDQKLDAFESTSAIRLSREALHVWYARALQSNQLQVAAYTKAIAQDRRMLLKQSLETWREALFYRQEEQRQIREVQIKLQDEQNREAEAKYLEQKASKHRSQYVLRKAFTHWATAGADEKVKTTIAKNHILKVTYFGHWKKVAIENQIKIRSIPLRRFFSIWQAKTDARILLRQQAEAHYRDRLLSKYKAKWFWHLCSQHVEAWHDQWVKRKAMRQLLASFRFQQEQNHRAEDVHRNNVARRALSCLGDRSHQCQRALIGARDHYDGGVKSNSLRSVRKNAKIAPLARNMTLKVTLDLQRKAFRVWWLHLSLIRQAAVVDRKRILQTAWTNWNDGLRCRALAQKIDERVLVESLYRWVLQERLKLFQRTVDSRLLSRAFAWWLVKARQERDQLAEAEIIFAERRRRRRLAFGMVRLNIAVRNREDAERAAVEMANSRVLPIALNTWKEKADNVEMLDRWAADARFYTLCSLALKVWNERTTEHIQNRRRNAYVQLRAHVKIRLAKHCFVRWRTKTMEIRSMHGEAERRVEARNAEVAASAFDRWRGKTAQCAGLDVQAVDFYQGNLLGSAISAIVMKHDPIRSMDGAATQFRQDTDLALLGAALRRTQWATFTVTRKSESATALWAKNRDQHLKHMIRHWAGQAAARGKHRTGNAEEPESPSLRPASRAASRTADVTLPSSPPNAGAVTSTPGYMRTPSRGRRAGRFRSIPTLASFTPMTFDSAYLATTPAPVPSPERHGPDPFDGDMTSLTPQVTPFSRKLRAGGFTPAPPSALRTAVFGRSAQEGTNKIVRFGSAQRFRTMTDERHEKDS